MFSKWRRSAFRSLRDVGLFLKSSRADAALKSYRRGADTAPEAFDRLYGKAAHHDPWASGLPQYQYQRRKYDALVDMLPSRSFSLALDLGCGLGLLTERLAQRSQQVVGIDISSVAIRCAEQRTSSLRNVSFKQGDITDLDPAMNGTFDLVVVADTLYYLPPPLLDITLDSLAIRIQQLLRRDGILLVANHYFPLPLAETRLTKRIHAAFSSAPNLILIEEHKRAFFLASLYSARPLFQTI